MSYSDTIAALPGVVACWTLDEASGTFADSVGTHTASAVGTVTRDVAGLVSDGGKAVTPAATSSYVTAPAHADWGFGTGAFWFCGWFKTTTSDLQVICGWGLVQFVCVAGGVLRFGNADGNQDGTTPVNDGQRHFFCVTRDGSGNLRVYLDGSTTPEISKTSPSDLSAGLTGSNFEMGAGGGNYALVGGTLDGFAIGSGFGLSGAASAAIYSAGATGTALAAGTLSATGHTSTTASFSWTAGSGGTAPITAQLQKSAAGAGSWSNVSGATASPATATGLAAATAYDFRVVYTDAVAATATSNTVTTTTGSASGGSISLASPTAYLLRQRGASGTAAVVVSGTYAGTPATIEVGIDGDFATLVASPSGGTFSGTIALPAGSATVAVRFSDDHTATDSVANVLAGDLFGLAGQSNAVGQGVASQDYDPDNGIAGAKYTRAGAWATLADPVDSTDSHGSIWPPLAAAIVDRTGVPAGLVPCGADGSSIASWVPGQGNYTAMVARVRAAAGTTGAGGVRGVFWWQGETDAAAGMAQATYLGHLEDLADGVWSDLGCPLIVFRLQEISADPDDLAAIQAAQAGAIATHAHVLDGGDFSGIVADDGNHLTSSPKLIEAAGIAAAATVAALLAPTSATSGEIDDVIAQDIIDGVAAAILASPTHPLANDASGRVLLQPTQTGVTIPTVTAVGTVTTLTGYVAPTNADTSGVTTLLARLSSARAGYIDNLSAGAVALATQVPANFTTATFASAGVFATGALANAPTSGSASLGATAPAGWIDAAAIASGAISSAKFATITPGLIGFLERLLLLTQRFLPVAGGSVTAPKSGNGSVVVKGAGGATLATMAATTDGTTQTLGAAQ